MLLLLNQVDAHHISYSTCAGDEHNKNKLCEITFFLKYSRLKFYETVTSVHNSFSVSQITINT